MLMAGRAAPAGRKNCSGGCRRMLRRAGAVLPGGKRPQRAAAGLCYEKKRNGHLIRPAMVGSAMEMAGM